MLWFAERPQLHRLLPGLEKGDGGITETHHPRYQRSLDELFLHVYVYIADWLEPYYEHLPKHSR